MSTARLKKRVAEDDSLQNNNLNESFVQYGTPLPSLASTKKDQGEYVPIWQQEVRDEQGRRRLHGAFTGGFSAGYFNTAGSKEGWAPSTFVSKKEAKGKQRAEQRPEDFMDEEDLAELKASKSFQTTESYGGGQSRPQDAFAGLGSAPAASSSADATKKDPAYSVAVANSLRDLVKPGSRRIGQKIMTKMGWRPGQGIGPRVSYARRKQQMKEMGMEDENDGEHDEQAEKHTFAPLDRTVLTFESKENQWGLGYVPGQPLADTLQGQGASQSTSYSIPVSDQARFGRNGQKGDSGPQSRMPMGGAFGISALEDADEDDMDVYGGGPSGPSTMVLNDEDDNEDGFAAFGGSSRRPELLKRNGRQKQEIRKVRQLDPALTAQGQTFSDGSPMLPGFVLASQIQPSDKWFAPEPIPKNWQPNPKAIWERERLKVASPAQAGAANLPAPQKKGQQNMLSADDRANILGETVAPKSIFDFLSSKDKERLQGLGNLDGSTAVKPAVAGPTPQPEILRIPAIDPRVAQSALKGFMPYGDDPAKQARYKAFLQHFAMPQDAARPFKPSQHSGKGVSEQNAELEAFANAAMIFKPMSGMMANRFTSSSQTALLDIKAPEAGLHLPKPVSDSKKILAENEEEQKRKRQEERESADPRRAAVREGNFGALTRTVQPWYPARLLCKRFNVADPHPDGAPNDTSTSSQPFDRPPPSQPESDILGKDALDSMMRDRKTNNTGDGFVGGVSFAPGANAQPGTPPLDTAVEEDERAQGEDMTSYEKPSMDIFKAIFASDDEEDEDETDEKEDEARLENQAVKLDNPSRLPDASMPDSKPGEDAVSLKIEDLSSFKPTFISRSDRSTVKDDAKRKVKEKKKKKKATAVLSFHVEDGDEESAMFHPDPGSRKRKAGSKEAKASKKDRRPDMESLNDAEEDEWVEKEVAPIVGHSISSPAEQQNNQSRKAARVTASQLF